MGARLFSILRKSYSRISNYFKGSPNSVSVVASMALLTAAASLAQGKAEIANSLALYAFCALVFGLVYTAVFMTKGKNNESDQRGSGSK